MKNLWIISFLLLDDLFTNSVYAQDYRIRVNPNHSKNWGYTNLKGELIIEDDFVECTNFSTEVFAVIHEAIASYIIDIYGNTLELNIPLKKKYTYGIKECGNDLFAVKLANKKWAYFNTKGKLIYEPKFNTATQFNNRYATARIGETYYALDTLGNEIPIKDLENLIDIVKEFSNGYAPYKNKDNLWGMINTKGEIALPAKHMNIGRIHVGMDWLRADNHKFEYINIKADTIINPTLDTAYDFEQEGGMARVIFSDDLHWINKTGSLFTFKETDIHQNLSNGLLRARKHGLFGFLNNTGERVIPPKFTNVRPFVKIMPKLE